MALPQKWRCHQYFAIIRTPICYIFSVNNSDWHLCFIYVTPAGFIIRVMVSNGDLSYFFWISQDTNVGFCCLFCHHLLWSSAKNVQKIRMHSRVTCKLAIIGPRPVCCESTVNRRKAFEQSKLFVSPFILPQNFPV